MSEAALPYEALLQRIGGAVDAARLTAVLDARWRQARQRHPRVHAPAAAWLRRIGDAVATAGDPTAALERLHTDDLYVVLAAADGDDVALVAIERGAIAPIERALGHMQLPLALVDEVKQIVRTKLMVPEPGAAMRLLDYSGTGELRAWVGVIATREALTLLRRDQRTSTPADELLAQAPATLTGPELGFLKEHYREQFRSAFTEALAELAPRERNALRHHYVQALTIDQIAAIYGVHRSNAARRVAKAREAVLSGTRRRLVLGLRVDRAEFDSIMRLIESRIDVSVQRMLGGDDEAGAP